MRPATENPVIFLTSQIRCCWKGESTCLGFVGAWVRSSKSVRFRHLQMVGRRDPCTFPATVLRSGLSARGALFIAWMSISHERVLQVP